MEEKDAVAGLLLKKVELGTLPGKKVRKCLLGLRNAEFRLQLGIQEKVTLSTGRNIRKNL